MGIPWRSWWLRLRASTAGDKVESCWDLWESMGTACYVEFLIKKKKNTLRWRDNSLWELLWSDPVHSYLPDLISHCILPRSCFWSLASSVCVCVCVFSR